MSRHPILQEIYDAREQILAEYAGDVSAYLRDAQQRLLASWRPIANIKQRTIRRTGAAKPGISAVEAQAAPPGNR